jgi:HTH-type transcriptional regulator/antitoxin MqsA
MERINQCPVCGAGQAVSRLAEVAHEYKGQKEILTFHMQECDACGSEFAGPAEARDNKRSVVAFQKRVDGMLSGTEIKALRKQYKINQSQAAALFGGGPVAFSKYENDEITQAESMDKLLRLVRGNESAFWTLVQQSSLADTLSPKQHRKVYRQATNIVYVNFQGNDEFRKLDSTLYDVKNEEKRQWK